LLKAKGLTGSKSGEEYSDTVPAGSIIRQGTDANTEVTKGTTISYVVSLGPEPSTGEGDETTDTETTEPGTQESETQESETEESETPSAENLVTQTSTTEGTSAENQDGGN